MNEMYTKVTELKIFYYSRMNTIIDHTMYDIYDEITVKSKNQHGVLHVHTYTYVFRTDKNTENTRRKQGMTNFMNDEFAEVFVERQHEGYR